MFLVWKQNIFIAITSNEEDAAILAAIHKATHKRLPPLHYLSTAVTLAMKSPNETGTFFLVTKERFIAITHIKEDAMLLASLHDATVQSLPVLPFVIMAIGFVIHLMKG